jgi:GTP:adenosylcobinamide-phosphate guanylyltransferase
MRKRTVFVAALGVACLLVAGGLLASNMGFKLNYVLDGPGDSGSNSGTQTFAMPFNQQTTLVDAEDLINDINTTAGSNVVVSVSRFLRTTDKLDAYTGSSGTNFTLTPGEGYIVKVSAGLPYIVVGSHDPNLAITFDGPGDNGSNSGTQVYALPYHSTAAVAGDLIDEINLAAGADVVVSISRYLRTTDKLDAYTGSSGTNFALAPGESYTVKVNSSISFIPSHY